VERPLALDAGRHPRRRRPHRPGCDAEEIETALFCENPIASVAFNLVVVSIEPFRRPTAADALASCKD
jgi:hypothetical protein